MTLKARLCALTALLMVPVAALATASAALVAEATSLIGEAGGAVDQVSELLDSLEGDETQAERYQCVQNELTSMTAQMSTAESAQASLAVAADDATAQMQFDLIAAAHSGIMSGLAEALKCGGTGDGSTAAGGTSGTRTNIPAGAITSNTGTAGGSGTMGGTRDNGTTDVIPEGSEITPTN